MEQNDSKPLAWQAAVAWLSLAASVPLYPIAFWLDKTQACQAVSAHQPEPVCWGNSSTSALLVWAAMLVLVAVFLFVTSAEHRTGLSLVGAGLAAVLALAPGIYGILLAAGLLVILSWLAVDAARSRWLTDCAGLAFLVGFLATSGMRFLSFDTGVAPSLLFTQYAMGFTAVVLLLASRTVDRFPAVPVA